MYKILIQLSNSKALLKYINNINYNFAIFLVKNYVIFDYKFCTQEFIRICTRNINNKYK